MLRQNCQKAPSARQGMNFKIANWRFESSSNLAWFWYHLQISSNIHVLMDQYSFLSILQISILELVSSACHFNIDPSLTEVIVYDQGNIDPANVAQESFLYVLLTKLKLVFKTVSAVSCGFIQFKNIYPELCEDKSRKSTLTTLSQPCISLNNQGGPTKILPFLYLGSQQDALNRELCRVCLCWCILTCFNPSFFSSV